ncbi:hypothetical protein SISNIDRAFT_489792 [Sistotremastrum niveocremeum HHB9708]|uniref:Uncharacterized protein n=1 Tax=Sistotremastrum niveocremeum HHB9708 TaxID=1314777 RepID=A0A164PID5_9AGAM|nr:hypothetical protein SISNIDRAFT_489792 [Sistotremastrum niveocremeum HHB9708]
MGPSDDHPPSEDLWSNRNIDNAINLSMFIAQTSDRPQAGTLSSPLQPGTPSQGASSSDISPSDFLGTHYLSELSAPSFGLGLEEILSLNGGYTGPTSFTPEFDLWTGEPSHSLSAGFRLSELWADVTEPLPVPAPELGGPVLTLDDLALPPMPLLPPLPPTVDPSPPAPLNDFFPPLPTPTPPPTQPSGSKKRKASSKLEESKDAPSNPGRRKRPRLEANASQAGPSTPKQHDPPTPSHSTPSFAIPSTSSTPLHRYSPTQSSPLARPPVTAVSPSESQSSSVPHRPPTARSHRGPPSSPPAAPVASGSAIGPLAAPTSSSPTLLESEAPVAGPVDLPLPPAPTRSKRKRDVSDDAQEVQAPSKRTRRKSTTRKGKAKATDEDFEEWGMRFAYDPNETIVASEPGEGNTSAQGKQFVGKPKKELPCHSVQRDPAETLDELFRRYTTGDDKSGFVCVYPDLANPGQDGGSMVPCSDRDTVRRHLQKLYRYERNLYDRGRLRLQDARLVNLFHYCKKLVKDSCVYECKDDECMKKGEPVTFSRWDAAKRHYHHPRHRQNISLKIDGEYDRVAMSAEEIAKFELKEEEEKRRAKAKREADKEAKQKAEPTPKPKPEPKMTKTTKTKTKPKPKKTKNAVASSSRRKLEEALEDGLDDVENEYEEADDPNDSDYHN